MKVAADKGIGRLSHAEVAQCAGVSTPTAFLYFPDREALVKAVIGEVDRFYRAMARRSHASTKPPMQRIHDHLFTFSDSIESYSPRSRRDLQDLRIADLGDAESDADVEAAASSSAARRTCANGCPGS